MKYLKNLLQFWAQIFVSCDQEKLQEVATEIKYKDY